jgi:hypothetical protein
MPNINDEIRSTTEAFVSHLTVLVRQAALESVTAALGGAAAVAAPVHVATKRGRPKKAAAPVQVAAPVQITAKRGRGRPKKVVTPAASPAKAPAPATVAPAAKAPAAEPAPAAKAASKAAPAPKAPVSKQAAAPKRVSGEKRPPAELAKLTEKLGEYIKAHPGLRIEPIGKALSTPTKELNLPIKKLLAAKTIRSVGQKRATEYFSA